MRYLAALAIFLATPALAHEGDTSGGLMAGIAHPFGGLDHVAAMVAVGIWGSLLGRPLLIILPLTFPAMMAVGAGLGILALPFPAIEVGIALSAVVLGAILALRFRPPEWIAVAIVGIFALFHGYAHGIELAPGADPIAYAAGFIVATGLLHAIGIGIGEAALRVPAPRLVFTLTGVVIAAIGLFFLSGALGIA